MLALPGLPAGLTWELSLCTDKNVELTVTEERSCSVPARSICIFKSKKAAKTAKITGMAKK